MICNMICCFVGSIDRNETDIDWMFDNHSNGFGGSFSANDVACLSSKASTSTDTTSTTCLYGSSTIVWYNRVMVLLAMTVSPQILQTSMQSVDHRSSDANRHQLFAGKMLLMGLGSGSLTSYLTTKFPSLAIDNVEIDSEIIDVCLNYFGGKYYICDILTIQEDVAEFVLTNMEVRLQPSLLDAYLSNTNHTVFYDNAGAVATDANRDEDGNISGVGKRECRVKVYEGDAWKFIDILNHAIESQGSSSSSSSSRFYDYILIDLFSELATYWSGVVFEDQSNVIVDGLDHYLRKIRTLLSPDDGVAVFHIHKDSYYEYYRNKIVEAFGKKNVVDFVVRRNDVMVVATRGIFESSSEGTTVIHPCNDIDNFQAHIVNTAETLGLSNQDIAASRYLLDCHYFDL